LRWRRREGGKEGRRERGREGDKMAQGLLRQDSPVSEDRSDSHSRSEAMDMFGTPPRTIPEELNRKDTYVSFVTEAVHERRLRETRTVRRSVRRTFRDRVKRIFRRDDSWINL